MSTTSPVIDLDGIWRRYRVASASRPRGLRASISRDPLRQDRDRWFWALRDIDLCVRRGEAVALVGRNGAGKSTLLRLIGGVGRPDRGTMRVEGRIGALIDLGHELHGDLTGRRNAELAAVVAGMTRREFRARIGEILAFAELEEFADEPLRAYSDGMRARLAFSVMAHVDPDVLLVDEVLAVGDAPFQRRSVDRIDALRRKGTAVVFVSHDLGLVRRVCDRAVWLDHGAVLADGESREVVGRYLDTTVGDSPQPARRSSGRATIRAASVLDAWDAPVSDMRIGDGLVVEADIEIGCEQSAAMLRVRIVRSMTGATVVDTSTPVPAGRTARRVRFDRLDLTPGEHRVEVALFTPDWTEILDEVHALTVVVTGEGPDSAPMAPPHEWQIVR